MAKLLDFQRFYFVGAKGVAMTSLAQCLVEAGKSVQGSDVAEEFVTQKILDQLHIQIDQGFEGEIPSEVECVVYTSAHQARQNPQVVQALTKNLPVFSQAEAIAELFNQKQGIAVCGVGGKSTTSAMIAWILEKTGRQPSFSIGVGNIPGLEKTGQWRSETSFFVAEADEYVTDPSAPSRNEEITPRFSFLKPTVTVCTNLVFDHPDVYKDFEHTKSVFTRFFTQIQNGGALIINSQSKKEIIEKLSVPIITFGEEEGSNFQIQNFESSVGQTKAQVVHQAQSYSLTLQIPGLYNVRNAVAAIAAASQIGVPIEESISALAGFRSTMRRCEYIGEKNGVRFYDDYAHHPNEIKQVIHAYHEWFPQAKLIVAFQSHTFSRTKALYDQFVAAFAEASEVLMIDIFASARESFDDTISSDGLCDSIHAAFPQVRAQNLKTLPQLSEYIQAHLQPGDVCLTVGAGDIYKVHELIQ
jgi:UDP-N-acetylmuramate--alanine ligase